MLAEQVTKMNTKFNAVKRVVCRRSRSGASLFSVAMACLILAGCASQSGSRAPVNDLNQSSSNTATQARTYTVKAGDTLTKISRTTGADENTIKRINKISDPRKIYPGLILKLSDGSETAASGMAPVTPTTRAEVRPLDQADSSSSSASAEPSTPSRASDAGVINWGWPAQGKVIQGFTVNTKGIDIAGAAGDPVIAAANGKVMYSGNGVRGLGNLIIVDHDNGFITAYAHNRALLVKTGQKIKKGTKIAEMGQSDASSVKLHFEVRRQGTPVDPLQYLPAK